MPSVLVLRVARGLVAHVLVAAFKERRFFLALALADAFLAASVSSPLWDRSFHFLQPSKSMRACIQPHSMTLRWNQVNIRGCFASWCQRIRGSVEFSGEGGTHLG